MALQICPKCKEHAFTWYISENNAGGEVTIWQCASCEYYAFEYDERMSRPCPHCGSGQESKLLDQENEYWWCYCCNSTNVVASFK